MARIKYKLIKVNGMPKTEHRYLVEQVFGRPLPKQAVIHHVDGNSFNNNLNNLVICEDQNYHRLIHARQRRLLQNGSANLKKCPICKQVKNVSDFYAVKTAKGGIKHIYECKKCIYAKRKNYYRQYNLQHRGRAIP